MFKIKLEIKNKLYIKAFQPTKSKNLYKTKYKVYNKYYLITYIGF